MIFNTMRLIFQSYVFGSSGVDKWMNLTRMLGYECYRVLCPKEISIEGTVPHSNTIPNRIISVKLIHDDE